MYSSLGGFLVAGGLGGLVAILISDEGDLDGLAVRGDVFVASFDNEALLFSVILVLTMLLSRGTVARFKPGEQ